MEQVTRLPQRQQESHAPSLPVPRYLVAAFILWLGFTGISLGVWALGQGTELPSNPFATFADVFPGQPRSAVEARGFLCSRRLYEYLPKEHCTLNPTDGAFSQVGVAVSESVVDEISFRMRDDTLRVGDLMALLGSSDFHEYSYSTYLFLWRSSGVTAIGTNTTGRFSLFRPVWRVTIATDLLSP